MVFDDDGERTLKENMVKEKEREIKKLKLLAGFASVELVSI